MFFKNNIPLSFFMAFALVSFIVLPNNLLAKTSNPQEIIISTLSNLETDLIAQGEKLKNNPELASGILKKHILPVINFNILSRYVLGKNWRKASKAEQEEFIILFRQLLIKFYTKVFIEYLQDNTLHAGMTKFLPYHEKKKSKHARIKTSMKVSPTSPKIMVIYSLYNSKTGWKAYDISIEGISLVTTYRSSFAQIIKNKKMPGLLEHIHEKLNKINVNNESENTSMTKKS